MVLKLEDLIQTGDRDEFFMYLQRAKSLGLEDEVTRAEEELSLKRIETSNWLTHAIQEWEADRCTIERNIDEAKRLGLEDIITTVEAAISAREKVVTQGLEISITEGLRSTFDQWIKKAEKMGMEELVTKSQAALEEKTEEIRRTLLETANTGTREDFISISDKANYLGLTDDVRRGAKIVQKRVSDLMTISVGVATDMLRSGVYHSEDWDSLKAHAQFLGIGCDVLEHIRENVFETEGSCSAGSRCESSNSSTQMYEMEHMTSEDIQEPSREALVDAVSYIPLSSMMQNWKEIEVVRKKWQKHMRDVQNDEQYLSYTAFDRDIYERSAFSPCSGSCSEDCSSTKIEKDKNMEIAAENCKVGVAHSFREQTDYESDGDERQDIEGSWMQPLRSNENTEMEVILSIPLILTRVTMEQKMNCSRTELQWFAELDLNHEGLSSLGEGVISEWCPKTKIFTCDMNRLTTLQGAFAGCEETLERISARNNFMTDVSGLENLFSLETLHLDGNNISTLAACTPANEDAADALKSVKTCCHDDLHSGFQPSAKAAEHLSYRHKDCWPKMNELSLSCNRITKVSMLGRLCPNLQVLDLGSNHLLTMGGPDGSALAGLRHLRVLDVGQNRLNGRSLWEALKHCPLLISLVASRNRLTELPTFCGSVLLRELWLNGNAIRRLSCLAWMPNLQRLYLQDNSIESLEPLWGCPALEVLDLSFNSISELSQLRQLACFIHLRTLQLNDNPVSEQADYVGTVLEAVPWLMELDNEAVLESGKDRVVKRLFLKVMENVGMQYLHEKAARGEIVVSDFGKPDEIHKIVIGCRSHQKLSWFHNLHSESIISATGHCQASSCSGKYMVPLKMFRNGTADRAILWAAMFEATLFESTRYALRRLLDANPGDGDGKGLVLSSDLEAKQNVFAMQEMCFSQREKLILANKDLASEREVTVNEQPAEACLQQVEFFSDNNSIDSLRGELASSASSRRGIDDLEFCLQQHLSFRVLPRTCKIDSKYVERNEQMATKLQAFTRGCLSRLRFQQCRKAAWKIQAAWRGYKAKKSLPLLNVLPDDACRKAGILLVIKVQALWRGYAFRLKFRKVIAKSKYVDEDIFEYNAIDEDEFFAGESTMEAQIPDLILGSDRDSTPHTSECASDLTRLPERGDNLFQIISDGHASRFPCEKGNLNPVEDVSLKQAEEKKRVQMAQIAEEWGFKDERTVKQFLKACKKVRKQRKIRKPALQDPQKRLEMFKAKAEAPAEHTQTRQHLEKMISSINRRTDKDHEQESSTIAGEIRKPPPIERDVVKPILYPFAIPSH